MEPRPRTIAELARQPKEPSNTAQALLGEIADLQVKLQSFFGDPKYHPHTRLASLSKADAVAREGILRAIADWHTLRSFHRSLCGAVKHADEARLTAVVGRIMKNTAEPACGYCRSLLELLRSRTLSIQVGEIPLDSLRPEVRREAARILGSEVEVACE